MLIFEENNVSEKKLDFSLRTNERAFQTISNTAYAIFIGLMMTTLGIGFDLVKNTRKKISLKKEIRFFLITYFSNGFVIWSIILMLTEVFKHETIIHEFRNMLWINQLFLVILIPIISQNMLNQIKKHTINIAVKRVLSKYVRISVILSISLSIIILSYAIYAANILAIIPKDIPDTRSPEINFGEYTLRLAITGYLVSIFSLGISRTKKYFHDNNDVEIKDFRILNRRNRWVIIVSLSVIGLIYYLFTNH